MHYPKTRKDSVVDSYFGHDIDHDDRVVPAHSYKFIAELQDKHQGENPVLIRIDVNAGHGAGMPLSKQIDLTTDIYAFTLYNMGIESL